MNGQVDINEYYSLLREIQYIEDEDIQEANTIRDNIVSEHPEYSAGKDGEFYRLEINHSESIEPAVRKEELGFYKHPNDYCYMSDIKTNYEDYLQIAKAFEEHCKYIYSLIVEAYKKLEEQVVTIPTEAKEKEQQIERLKKIKRAKELIALSKEQDGKISELESQIQREEFEVDE